MGLINDIAIISLKTARGVIKKALEDPDLRIGYEANIACVLMDAFADSEPDIMVYEQRMKIAGKILDRVFLDRF